MSKLKITNPINLAIILILIAGSYIGYYTWKTKISTKKASSSSEQTINNSIEVPKKSDQLKIFTGEQFKDLYNSIAYPNTEYINDDTVITGDANVDEHIQKLAEAKGYKRRSAPVSDAFITVEKDLKLQQKAYQPWLDLVAAAQKDNLKLNLVDAYRSSADARNLFLSRLNSYNINTSQIASGIYDSQINNLLKTTAIPGYSRHHTGYTVDIGCNDQSEAVFKYTPCFEWLSADNYKNAKTYGWIPSYPDGAGQQGPDPEPWEYVWVSVNSTFENQK